MHPLARENPMQDVPRSLSATVRIGLGLLVASLGCVACQSPERAPRQPVSGVDRPADDRSSRSDASHDEETPVADAGSSAAEVPDEGAAVVSSSASDTGVASSSTSSPYSYAWIGEFVDRVAPKLPAGATVAVFWPMSPHPNDSNRWTVNALGERVAEEITDALATTGAEPIAGTTLQDQVATTNRGLGWLEDSRAALPLAQRMDADFVIYGTIERRIFDRMNRDEHLAVRLACHSLDERRDVAPALRAEIPARDRDAYKEYRLPGSVAVGRDAAPTRPSLDLEFQILVRMLVRQIVSEADVELRGKRIVVERTDLPVERESDAQLAVLQDAVTRRYESALEAASREDVDDPRAEVLASGPVEVLGKSYPTFADAFDRIRSQRAARDATRTGQLARDLGRTIAETLARYHGEVELASDATDRERLLDVIRREVRSAREDGAVDEATIAELRADGADLLLTSSIRKLFDGYELRASLVDLRSGRSITASPMPFEAVFDAPLDELFASSP